MAAPTIADTQIAPAGIGGGVEAIYLCVLGAQGRSIHQLPRQGEILIGRSEEAPVRLVDPLSSRLHARLHVDGDRIEIEDLGSANGTRVREQRIAAGTRVPLQIGDGVSVGSTVLILQSRAPTFRSRQIWPHGYFEGRLVEECARAQSLRSTFALVRVRLESPADAARAGTLLATALRPGDVLATYGPREYEILLVDSGLPQSEAVREQIQRSLEEERVPASSSLAFYPADGTSPEALITRATCLLLGQEACTAAPRPVVESARMREVYAIAERAAAGTINVLALGETGVGKEVLAETIHRKSPRRDRPFVCINCAALSETLLESELFGHEKGAFTGALHSRPGLIESAAGGTVFLDEVGEMPLALQTKLLRALETRQVTRVGGVRPRAVDVRFVAATNRDLEDEVAQKAFRQDLFYRLNGIALVIPPLRERIEEIEPLASLFLEGAARQLGRPAPELSAEALALLESYGWPGNIRELRNVIERALLLCPNGVITPEYLPVQKMRRTAEPAISPRMPAEPLPDPVEVGLKRSVRDQQTTIERQIIQEALERCAGNQTRAAELLGISRRTLCSRIKEYSLPRPRG